MEMFTTQQTRHIAFVHHKGGTGKTTSCLNIGGCLNKLGKKVLIVDLDPQANATAGLGVDMHSVTTSLTDVLVGNADIHDAIHETASGIYLVPATLDLIEAEIYLAGKYNAASLLRDKIADLGSEFDFILLDAPGSGLLMINAILASRNLIIPIDSGIFGFETLETLKNLLQDIQQKYQVEIHIMMALLKSFSASLFDRGLTKSVKHWIEEFFFDNALKSCRVCTIPFSRKIYQAQHAGLPVSHYAPLNRVSRVYQRIAKEIIGGI